MARILVFLCVIFSLLAAPIVHASDFGCKMSEQTTKQTKSEKQDDDKLAKISHHCCCTHSVSYKIDSENDSIMFGLSNSFSVFEDNSLSSVTLGPPLEPPSHA